jgi:anti-sigma-K factor RskA
MGPHEKFLELCASATARELTADEQATLNEHLATCPKCRQAMKEYEVASRVGVVAFASDIAPQEKEVDGAWSVEDAERVLLKRLDAEEESSRASEERAGSSKGGQRFGYRPSKVQWREVWMSLAAVVLLALALAITAYRSGVKRGADIARTSNEQGKDLASLEEQVSDVGHERVQLLAKLAEQDKTIADLRSELSQQQNVIAELRTPNGTAGHSVGREPVQASTEKDVQRDRQLAAAEAKSLELQKTIDTVTGQRDEVTARSTVLEAKVNELTGLLRDREREIDEKQEQVAKQQDLLEHDRDIRELMGARDLYIAEIHDVDGTGETNKTYGRVFYTRGKRLVFYAYDLDAQPGIRNASTFQAWGRRGPDKQQAHSLGIFYEDNLSKKRWVLKSDDSKALQDIDGVFVTVEPNGGSQHPSGKQLLFAYLRVNPNHP